MSLFLVTKQGATFGYVVTFASKSSGTPLTGLASKLKCEVRTPENDLLGAMTIVETSTPGKYTFRSTADTSAWPLLLLTDIKYENSHGDNIPFSTITIKVLPGVTK